MKDKADLNSWAFHLILKSVMTAARWAAMSRTRTYAELIASPLDEVRKENVALRDEVATLKDLVSILTGQLGACEQRPRCTIKQRLQILRHMELFQIPNRKAREYFCIARSTIARWRRELNRSNTSRPEPANKTPVDIVRLVWEIAGSNEKWGKLRIAQQLAVLNIFLSASTVRNILNRSRPRDAKEEPARRTTTTNKPVAKPIAARHPNDVWSADLTTVKTWRVRSTHLLAVIDHFSRRVVAMLPLKRPDSQSLIAAMEEAVARSGSPTRLITDEGSVFTSRELAAFLKNKNISHEIGALGQSDSIAVTERLFLTLKSEWLCRVVFVRGFGHLTELCGSFLEWANDLRPHQRIGGARPSDVHEDGLSGKPARPALPRTAKAVPANIERMHFSHTRISAWRLKPAA